MTDRKPARTATRRIPIRRVRAASLLVIIAAITAALGYQLLASSSSPAASPTDAPPSQHPGAIGEAMPSAERPARGQAAVLGGPARPSATCGDTGARVVRFRVLLEDGLATTPATFVKDLLSVLCDERSWIGSGKVRFRYDPKGSLLIGLRTPTSTEKACRRVVGQSVNFYYSCASTAEVVLNSDRWFTGSTSWPGSVREYRQMLVNHEIGHALGQHHRYCLRDGASAPVMMQQSKGLTTGGNTCKPNPWPLSYEARALRRR
jgi:Protein of unknown function (DUF3152)